MHILLISLAAAVAAAQTSSVAERLTRSPSVMVQAVVDGDTIEVTTVGRVQLFGIRAPVFRRSGAAAPFSGEARDRLAALVLRRWVRLEVPGRTAHSARRSAFVVRDDGVFVNAVLAGEGLARVDVTAIHEGPGVAADPATAPRIDELERAEAHARLFRRGLWGHLPPDPGAGYTHGSDAARPASIKPRKPAKTPRTPKTAATRPKRPSPKT
jgi:endonuclease YncB( thermonuclease family)